MLERERERLRAGDSPKAVNIKLKDRSGPLYYTILYYNRSHYNILNYDIIYTIVYYIILYNNIT